MNIQVNDFHWEPGKNDAAYIRLLESSRDEWQKLAQKAISKLKAQALRVLTVEEACNNCPDYVYVETKAGWLECTIKDCGESDRYNAFFVYGIDECFIELWSTYGKTWRCWSARPTDEERKRVKWDAS